MAKNEEEMLLLELLPTVANGFLKKRRTEEFEAAKVGAQAEAAVAEAEEKGADEPVTGPVYKTEMGGRIVEMRVKPGDAVKKGQVMFVYEAMKMENDVEAPADATVKRVFFAPGDVIATDDVIIEFQD